MPTNMNGMSLQVEGLRWHGPDHVSRGASVVGAPSRSECYGVVALTHAMRGYPGSEAVASRVPVLLHGWRPTVLLQQPSGS